MTTFATTLTVVLLSGVSAAEPLGDEWQGVWRGTMVHTGREGPASEVAVEFVVQPIAETDELSWKMTYNPDGMREWARRPEVCGVDRCQL